MCAFGSQPLMGSKASQWPSVFALPGRFGCKAEFCFKRTTSTVAYYSSELLKMIMRVLGS